MYFIDFKPRNYTFFLREKQEDSRRAHSDLKFLALITGSVYGLRSASWNESWEETETISCWLYWNEQQRNVSGILISNVHNILI